MVVAIQAPKTNNIAALMKKHITFDISLFSHLFTHSKEVPTLLHSEIETLIE